MGIYKYKQNNMKSIIIKESQLKRIIKNYALNESSEIMQKQNPMLVSVIDDMKKVMPDMQQKFCTSDGVTQDVINRKMFGGLQKVFGPKTKEFMDKFLNKINTLDNNSIMKMINDLRGMLKNPKRGIEYLKNFLGETDQPKQGEMNEQLFGLGIIASTLIGLVVFFALISLIAKLSGAYDMTDALGCGSKF